MLRMDRSVDVCMGSVCFAALPCPLLARSKGIVGARGVSSANGTGAAWRMVADRTGVADMQSGLDSL